MQRAFSKTAQVGQIAAVLIASEISYELLIFNELREKYDII